MTPTTRTLLGSIAAALPDPFDNADLLDSLFRVTTVMGGHAVPAAFDLGSDTVQVGAQLVTAGLASFEGADAGVFTWTKTPTSDFADEKVSADTSSGPPPVEMSADDLFGRTPRPPVKTSSPRGVF